MKEAAKGMLPLATDHAVSLEGYALIVGDDLGLKEKGCMPMKITANFPLKNGGVKNKTVNKFMVFTYCPFCGEKYA